MILTVQKVLAGAALVAAVAAGFLGEALISPALSESIKAVKGEEMEFLKQVFADADLFSKKEGELPHHRAYRNNPDGEPTLLGFVFMTHEVEPDELAYSSRIKMLVGMTTDGVITKIKMIDHREPFGYFSVDPPEFVQQFEGKSILDPFQEGRDIDSVTRATITIKGAARVIRKSARQIAQQHLREEQDD